MDRMWDSGSLGCGSIPHGGTQQYTNTTKQVVNSDELTTFFIINITTIISQVYTYKIDKLYNHRNSIY